MEFSDYLIFVDESGSPSMGGNIDPQYPLFVLTLLLVKKSNGCAGGVPGGKHLQVQTFWA